MGLRGFIEKLLFGGEKLPCPFCDTAGARKTADGRIHCKNQPCPNFDPIFARRGRPVSLAPVPTSGGFRPAVPLTIQYKNCAGQDRAFVVEKGSIVRKRNHLVAKVAPRGRKIALSRDRIQNLSEVEAQMPHQVATGQNWPSARERQVLAYHKKRHSTSPLFEKIRAKYPDF